jgi:MIP family channel proteins
MQVDPLLRKALAEGIGIFAFFFAGIGAIVATTQTAPYSALLPNVPASGLLVVALAHGIMLATMVSTLGAVSGGHFNPAVTLGLFVGRIIDLRTLVVYWCAQLIGSILAALAIMAAFPSSMWKPSHIGAAALASNIGVGQGIFIEALGTFFLVLAVYGTAVDPRHPPIGGLGIGLTLFVDILFAGGATGATMNPARAFGPAVVANFWTNHEVYWIGPLLGGALAGLIYKNVFWEPAPQQVGEPGTSLPPPVTRQAPPPGQRRRR